MQLVSGDGLGRDAARSRLGPHKPARARYIEEEVARNRPAEAERHISFAVRVRCPQWRRHQIRGDLQEAASESEAMPTTVAATVTLMTLCISIYPLCDEGTSSLPLNTKLLVSSLLLSKLLK